MREWYDKSMMFQKRALIIIGILIVAAGFMLFAFFQRSPVDPVRTFAACLTEKNVTMYGVDTCAACQNQKKLFGDAFAAVDYVNCAFHPTTCNALPSKGYPTWTMRGTVIAEGLIPLATLAQLTSCPLNETTLSRGS